MLTFWQHVLNSIGMWDVKWCEPRCIPLFIIIFPIVWPFFSQKLQDSANFFHINFPKTISHHFSHEGAINFPKHKRQKRLSQRRSALPERPGTLGRTGMSRSLDSLTWDPDWFRSVSWVQFSETLWLCPNSYWKWWFIVDLPIEHGDFPELS